jgi:hypothetical protein
LRVIVVSVPELWRNGKTTEELQKSGQQSRRVVFGFTLEGWRVVFRFGSVILTKAGNLAINYACDVTTVAEKLRNFFARPN